MRRSGRRISQGSPPVLAGCLAPRDHAPIFAPRQPLARGARPARWPTWTGEATPLPLSAPCAVSERHPAFGAVLSRPLPQGQVAGDRKVRSGHKAAEAVEVLLQVAGQLVGVDGSFAHLFIPSESVRPPLDRTENETRTTGASGRGRFLCRGLWHDQTLARRRMARSYSGPGRRSHFGRAHRSALVIDSQVGDGAAQASDEVVEDGAEARQAGLTAQLVEEARDVPAVGMCSTVAMPTRRRGREGPYSAGDTPFKHSLGVPWGQPLPPLSSTLRLFYPAAAHPAREHARAVASP
jgi:hypothetical protein